MRPLRLSHDPWAAAWPQDRGALAAALALAAAYPTFVGTLRIEIAGDIEAALAGLLADLADAGLAEDDLTAVGLVPGTGTAAHVTGLPATLAAGCEYERRPWLPVFDDGDDRHRAIWEAAARHDGAVTVLAETLDGIDCVRRAERVAIVAGDPALRRLAGKRGLRAVPRPPASRHLPAADVVVADARRPDDVALAAGFAGAVALVNDGGVTPLALAALGCDIPPA